MLGQTGSVFTRAKTGQAVERPWAFDQFDASEDTLAVVMQLLSGASSAERANVGTLVRRFSAKVNVQDDNGVLVGNWSGSYAPFVDPSSWVGSHAIMSQYKSTGAPVKFGQCWVFAGVLTSALRCIGVPARPVSNYESAHEHPPVDKVIDAVWDNAGKFLGLGTDSIWNFHVWCEAWNQAEWNACDATPQEQSGGLYQLGPAPLSAVKGNLGGSFDIDFVTSEVNADIRKSKLDAFGVKQLIGVDTTTVGLAVLTKVVGAASGPANVTSNYKSAPFKSSIVTLPSGLRITFAPPQAVNLGSDVKWSVVLENTSSGVLTAHATMSAQAISYDGVTLGNLGPGADVAHALGAGALVTVPLNVPFAVYRPWTGATRELQVAAFVEVIGTSDAWADIAHTTLETAPIAISLNPNHPVGPGQSVQATATFTNPLNVALNNAEMLFSVSSDLSVGGGSSASVFLGAVSPNATLNVPMAISVATGGPGLIGVTFRSDELAEVSGHTQLHTVGSDCNGNQVPDDQDIAGGTSTDLNANLVPDECECVVQHFCESTLNSSGNPAVLGTSGSASVSTNNLTLLVSGAAPSKPGVVCFGDGQQQTPFADGFMCILPRSTSLNRIPPVVYTDAQGAAQIALDLTAPGLAGLIVPNTTWSFQFWFRDLGGAGGSGSNLTDGVAVTFCP